MWFQVFCILIVSLEAVRVLNPCCQKEYKTHDEYYKDEEYHLPKRYEYGHGNHHRGHNDHSKNVGYKPINPPANHRESHRDHYNYHSSQEDHEYENLKLNLDKLGHNYYPHDELHNQDYAKHDDLSKGHLYNNGHDEKPNTYVYGGAHNDHRPQTYLPTIHYDREHGYEVRGKYEYLLPGILRSLQEPNKQDQDTLVTIYAYKPKKQHNYPKNFNQTVDYLYNKEKQLQDNRHTKFSNFNMEDTRQPNYYPKVHQS